jgi:hypothetical protein
MIQSISLDNLQALVNAQEETPVGNLLRVDLLLKQQLEERIKWGLYKHKDPFFFDFWLMMEWITLEYQRLVPGLTERLYEETFLGLNTLEPVLDYITRYHTLGFNPDVKIDLAEHIPYYEYYVSQLRPYLWDALKEELEISTPGAFGMLVPEGKPPF